MIGAKALDASLIDAKYGYAVDSHGDVGGLIVASPTQAKFEITCHGKAVMQVWHLKKVFLRLR